MSENLCGYPTKRTGEPCARTADHNGNHMTGTAIAGAKKREQARRSYRTGPRRLASSQRRAVSEREADYWRNYRRKRRYGLTPARYARLLDLQEHRCATCRKPLADLPPHMVQVDHDHTCCPDKVSCGRCVRGVLCQACNTNVALQESGRKNLADVERYLADPPARRLSRRTVLVRAA